jgi:hypothetical protein
MNVTRSLLDDIKTKQLHCYRHVQRIAEGRLPKEVVKVTILKNRVYLIKAVITTGHDERVT